MDTSKEKPTYALSLRTTLEWDIPLPPAPATPPVQIPTTKITHIRTKLTEDGLFHIAFDGPDRELFSAMMERADAQAIVASYTRLLALPFTPAKSN